MRQLSNLTYNRLGGIDADWNNNGEIVPYTLTPEEIEKVSGNIAAPSVEPVKQATFAEIERQRDERIHGGLEFNGHTYQTDPQSIIDIIGAVVSGADIDWLTADNTTVSLTAAELSQLGQALAAHKASLVYQARAHKNAVLELETIPEIEAYVASITWS